MAKTNWQQSETVYPSDMNQIGTEINQNTDDISNLATGMADLATNKATATLDQVLQSNGDGTSTFKTLNIPSPTDYGRYQSEFGFDGAELVDCGITEEVLNLNVKYDILEFPELNNSFTGGTSEYGFVFTSTDDISNLNLTIFNSTYCDKLRIRNNSTSELIAELDITNNNGKFNVDIEAPLIAGIEYRVTVNGFSSPTNTVYNRNSPGFPFANSKLTVIAGSAGGSNDSNNIYQFTNITPSFYATQGTATKTISNKNAISWGNLKYNVADLDSANGVEVEVGDYSKIDEMSASVDATADDMYFYGSRYESFVFSPSKSTNSIGISVLLWRYGAITGNFEVHVYDDNNGTPKTSLANILINTDSISSTEHTKCDFIIDIPTTLSKDTTYYIVFKDPDATSANDCIRIPCKTGASNGNVYYSSDGGSSWSNVSSKIVPFEIFSLDILKSQTSQNGENILDLSDIDPAQYPSLKTKFTLNRNTTSDKTPILSSPSWTWEGAGTDIGAWEVIADVTLDSDVAQVDFENLGLEEYRYLKLFLDLSSTASLPKNLTIRFNNNASFQYTPSDIIRESSNSARYFSQHTITNESGYSKSILSLFGGINTTNIVSLSNLITAISFIPESDNFAQGSTFTLLGVR